MISQIFDVLRVDWGGVSGVAEVQIVIYCRMFVPDIFQVIVPPPPVSHDVCSLFHIFVTILSRAAESRT